MESGKLSQYLSKFQETAINRTNYFTEMRKCISGYLSNSPYVDLAGFSQ